MADGAPAVALLGASKTFSGRTVLSGVDLDVRAGEVHGLLGQNGSGKSTLIKILSGYHAPDPGARLSVGGLPVELPLTPDAPRRLGMAFVHQDLGLADSMTVVETLRVGQYRTGFARRISWANERAEVRRILEPFGIALDPDEPIGNLRQVEKALIAIARAVEQIRDRPGGLLVLDEPTAYLPRGETLDLFSAVRAVTSQGIGVIFVSHTISEVLDITDRVTVLRDGHKVLTTETGGLTEREIIRHILGRHLDDLYPEIAVPAGEAVLTAERISGAGVSEASLAIREGEVLGVTGLLGSGWEELPYLLFGARAPASGSVAVGSDRFDLQRFTSADAIGAAMALLPVNRLRDGAAPTATVAENLTLPTLPRYFVGGRLRRGRERARARELLEAFDVRPPESGRALATLSGGNQQKVLVAKWFETSPRVLLLHEPASGIDIGAKTQIFRHVRNAASDGCAVLLATGEAPDLVHLCDRVLIFREGRVISALEGAQLTEERILEQSYLGTSPATRSGQGELG